MLEIYYSYLKDINIISLATIKKPVIVELWWYFNDNTELTNLSEQIQWNKIWYQIRHFYLTETVVVVKWDNGKK